jgi:hypothetical protein
MNNNISPERYVFWMNDISVLYKNEGYIKFVPTSDMTRVEQLNAFTRFFIYLILILFFFDKTDNFMYIPIIGLIMVIVLYNVFESDDDGKRAEILRMKHKNEMMTNQSDLNYRTYQVDDNGKIITVDIDDNIDIDKEKSQHYDLETGFYDSNGKIKFGKYNSGKYKSLKENKDVEYSLDEMRLYNMARSRKPTVDNPFMNPTTDEFNSDVAVAAVACNDDENVNNDIELKFNADLYRDLEDVFDRKNSQRQFYTVAHNVPNDQEAFARWCYKFPKTCKTDQDHCLRYEDLRVKY